MLTKTIDKMKSVSSVRQILVKSYFREDIVQHVNFSEKCFQVVYGVAYCAFFIPFSEAACSICHWLSFVTNYSA